MIIDCVSDLHGYFPALRGGDLLIIAGDLTARDRKEEYIKFWEWLNFQDYRKCVVIAGNHDNFLLSGSFPDTNPKVEYLQDTGTEFEGMKIWGSPWTRTFPGINTHCTAFVLNTEEELEEKWELIPDNIDILITHGPPGGILDKTISGHNVGSYSLLYRFHPNFPKLWVFGHIHEAYGTARMNGKIQVNASHVTHRYQPNNHPIRIDLRSPRYGGVFPRQAM